MKVQIHLDNLGPTELDSAANLITLLRGAPADGIAPRIPSAEGRTDSAQAIHRWWHRIGDGSKEFWRIAAKHPLATTQWTFDQLAKHARKPKRTLRSYYRNTYRAIRAEDAADPLRSWRSSTDSSLVYAMSEPVRQEILRLARLDDANKTGGVTQ